MIIHLGDADSPIFQAARFVKNRRGHSAKTAGTVSHRAFASPLGRIAQTIERQVDIEEKHGPVRVIMKDGVRQA